MSAIRLRRLNSDADRLRDYVRRHPRVRILQESGDPPESYQLEYRIRSLRKASDDVTEIDTHTVEINLPRNYPRVAPQCRMLSPVFHPNIAPHAICVGDHWSAGESLQSIVTRIGEILAFQSYNVRSPLNGEAARWVEENAGRLPLDTVSLLAEEDDQSAKKPAAATAGPATVAGRERISIAADPGQSPVESAAGTPPPRAAAQPAQPQVHSVVCSHCGQLYRIPATAKARKARCKACGEVFEFEI